MATTIAVVGLALTAAAAGTAAYQSHEQAQQAERYHKQQEEYQRRVAQAEAEARSVQAQQVGEQGAFERQKVEEAAHVLRSRLRVAAGESGLGLGGTYDALMRQINRASALNQEIIGRNVQLAQLGIFSGINPIQPLPGVMPAWLAAISGGLSGTASGLSITTSGMQISQQSGAGSGRRSA